MAGVQGERRLVAPPGLTAGAGEFVEMVCAKRVQKFGVTARQVTLDLGGVRQDSAKALAYALGPLCSIKAKAPAAAGPPEAHCFGLGRLAIAKRLGPAGARRDPARAVGCRRRTPSFVTGASPATGA